MVWCRNTWMACVVIILCGYFVNGWSRNLYTLSNNGYEGLTIAIHDDVEESDAIIERIKVVFVETSANLFRASRNRVFFKNITIVIPSKWTNKPDYHPAVFQSFETANIIVDQPNPLYGDSPYVKQSGSCGQEGEYIHLTPKFLLDEDNTLTMWGPPGWTLVHEFAHLRWGLFDEYGDNKYGHFYKSGGRTWPVGCTTQVRGYNLNYKSFQPCITNVTTGLPERDCRFFPDPNRQSTQASVMFMQFLKAIQDFCDNDSWNRAMFHNNAAPNKHNRLCGGKSAWEVMRLHDDFSKGESSPVKQLDTTPVFYFVQPRQVSKRIVLVLDISGSMKGDPLEKMRQATSTFILTTIEHGTEIGIVLFSTSASIVQELTTVNSMADRDAMINQLPVSVSGWTSIGSGIQSAIDVLIRNGSDPEGSHVVLLTDGAENRPPYIADMTPEAVRLGITIDTIAYGQNADMSIASIAARTGGKSFFASGKDNSTGLQDAFSGAARQGNGYGKNKKASLSIASDAVTVPSQETSSEIFFIDNTVGNNTVLSISYKFGISVSVLAPDGATYDNSSDGTIYNDRSSFNVLTIAIPGNAKAGKWSYNITSTYNQEQTVTLGVTSKLRNSDDDAIRVTSSLDVDSLTFTEVTIVIIYADVTKGYAPVLQATVIATVERPDAAEINVELVDNGAGSDMTSNDGTYSSYFTAMDFQGDGRYSVKINVYNKDGDAVVVDQGSSTGALPILSPQTAPLLISDEPLTTKTGDFQRTDAAGEFTVTGFPTDINYVVPDRIPPSKIIDLRAYIDGNIVTLQWTAPGDNMNQGNSSSYDIRLSYNHTELAENFTTGEQIFEFIVGNINAPQPGNSFEIFKYEITNFDQETSYYFAVRAMDDNNNTADSSNIVVTSYAPIILPPEVASPQVLIDGVGIGVGVSMAILVTIVVVVVVAFVFKKKRNPKIEEQTIPDPEAPPNTTSTRRNSHLFRANVTVTLSKESDTKNKQCTNKGIDETSPSTKLQTNSSSTLPKKFPRFTKPSVTGSKRA